MELNFKQASLQEILDYIPDIRREAYVDATLRMQREDNIVGLFGSVYSEAQSPIIDEALIYSCGLIPVPIIGVDALIFEHGDYSACDVIKSTMIYLTTQKCPLLYSSKMYVLDGTCSAVESAFRHCTGKPVLVYHEAETCKSVLQQVYGRGFSAARYQKVQTAFATLNSLLQQLAHSTLSGNVLGMLAFYSRFIFELEERIAFLAQICSLVSSAANGEPSVCSAVKRIPISVHCPDGIIQKIAPAIGSYFKPVQVQHGHCADIACAGCIYPAGRYVAY